MEKSSGHIGFADNGEYGIFEYYAHDGQVYKANVRVLIMPNGMRIGRWVCSAEVWPSWQVSYNIQFIEVSN